MTDHDRLTDIDKMSFEQALEELKAIVSRLERGEGALDDAISAYERGAALKRHCEKQLRAAEQKIEKISLDTNGSAQTEPLDVS